MFPFLPFFNFSNCSPGTTNLQQRNANNVKVVYAVHDENHKGTFTKYFVNAPQIVSSVFKIEYLSAPTTKGTTSSLNSFIKHETKSDEEIVQNNVVVSDTEQLKPQTNFLYNGKKGTVNDKEKEQQELIAQPVVASSSYEEFNDDFSPFQSKMRIKDSFERSKIEYSDSEDEELKIPVSTNDDLTINKIVNFDSKQIIDQEINSTNKTLMQPKLKKQNFEESQVPKVKVENMLLEIPVQNSKAGLGTESRCATLSPPKTELSPVPLAVSTLPCMQALRARQKAFQPSQAMLDFFGGASSPTRKVEGPQAKTATNSVKNGSFCSEPGPENIESNASTSEEILLATKDSNKRTIKLKRLRCSISGAGVESAIDAVCETSALAKTQLSNPGPELASENEENEDEEVEEVEEKENCTMNNTLKEEKNKNKTNLMSNVSIIRQEDESLPNEAETTKFIIATVGGNAVKYHKIDLCKKNETTVSAVREKSQTKLGGEIDKKINAIQIDFRKGKKHNFNNENDEYDMFGRKKIIDSAHTLGNRDNDELRLDGQLNEKIFDATTAVNANAFVVTQQQQEYSLFYNKKEHALFLSESRENTQNKEEVGTFADASNYEYERLQNNNKTNINFNQKPHVLNETTNINIQSSTTLSKNSNTIVDYNLQNNNSNSQGKASNFCSSNTKTNSFFGGGGFGESSSGMVNATESCANSFGGRGGGAAGSSILIKHANIINDDEIFGADVLIENNVIVQISTKITPPENAEVIDANGHFILPAGIDIYTRFSADNAFENGTKAALAGGTTTIINVVFPKTNETLAAAVDRVRCVADSYSKCCFGFSANIKGEWSELIKTQMTELVCKKNINSFLLELTTETSIFEALEHAKQLGAHCRIVAKNCEMAAILEKRQKASFASLSKLEAERAQRYCVYSQLTNGPVSVLTLRASRDLNKALRSGRVDGALVSAEVSLAAIDNRNNDNTCIDSAFELLANDILCTCISGENSSIPVDIQNRLTVLWERGVVQNARFDPMRFVAVTSTNAAKLFNLYPQKGRIAVGSNADIVLWDFSSSRQLNNETVHATPLITICQGKILYRNSKFSNELKTDKKNVKNDSLFVALKPNSPYLFSVVHLRDKVFNLSQSANSAKLKIDHKLEYESLHRLSLASDTSSSDKSAINEHKNFNASILTQHVINCPITAGVRNRNIESTNPPNRSATKVIYPPGGKTSGLW